MMNVKECILGSPGSSPEGPYTLSSEHDKLSLGAGSTDEDLESGVGHSSSDEDYYSSQDEVRDEKVSTYVLNETLKIHVSEKEQWLCLAKLPTDLKEEEFLSLCSEFGALKRYHLIMSDVTGKFKGYGLVEYRTKSSSIQAKHILDGHKLRGHTLEADWLTPDRVQETSLHSKCLFVDRLPTDYRDMGEFRKLFSSVINPPYCQIAMKNGVIQNWGLVEFQSSRDAEETLLAMDGYEILPGSKIRVQYCIPGVHAINVYMSFVNNPMDALYEKKALLEETPSTKVYDQLESLSKQNPWFVQSLQNIMAMNNGGTEALLKEPPKPPSSNKGGDPAQAALVLLLASSVVRSKENKSHGSIASLLQNVIKKLETGVSASDILKTFLPSSNATDLRSFISDLLVKNDSSQKKHQTLSSFFSSGSSSNSSTQQQTKDPTLTDLLLQSFQASVNKGKCSASSSSQSSPPPPTIQSNAHRGPSNKALQCSLHKSQSKNTHKPQQFSSSANVGLYPGGGAPASYVYAAPQIQTYRPSANASPLFSPTASFYPGLWPPPSQMSFPLNVVTTPQWPPGVLPILNTMDGGSGGVPYLTGTAVAYPTSLGGGAKRKIESIYGEALHKKVKLHEGA